MHGTLHHVSITCIDIDALEKFYGTFGFTLINHFKNEECTIRLLQGNNSCIELICFNNTTKESQSAELLRPGISHIALKVNELVKMRQHLLQAGRECKPVKPARMGGFSYFFTCDPEGNLIELIENNTN